VVKSADGKPLKGVRLEFHPLENRAYFKKMKTIPISLADNSGRFEAIFVDIHSPGIPAGKYKVTVHAIREHAVKLIPDAYTKQQTTPWTITIPSSGKSDIELQISKS